MVTTEPKRYRLDELSARSGVSGRNIRVYQDRGLLPPPQKRGRSALYSDKHLGLLRQISSLLDRGYTFAVIRELYAAQRAGFEISDLLDADNPPAHRRTALRTRPTVEDIFSYIGTVMDKRLIVLSLQTNVISLNDDGSLTVGNTGIVEVVRELIEIGLSGEDMAELGESTLNQAHEIAARFADLVIPAVQKNQAFIGLSDKEIHVAVAQKIRKSSAALRFLFAQELETILRDRFDNGDVER